MGKKDDQDLNVFGLYDPKDKLWLGNDTGPITYVNFELAKLAAQICTKRIGTKIEPLVFDKSDKKIKDFLTPEISAEDAIRLLEEDLQ